MADAEELRSLVLAAFEKAKRSNKADWKRMTLAVLKNRLLQLSDRQFTLDRYAVESMPQLAAQIPDTLHLETGPPAFVRLSDEAAKEIELRTDAMPTQSVVDAPDQGWKSVRIRDDIWDGIVDFADSRIYVWDTVDGVVRGRRVTDDAGVIDFPTLTEEEMTDWRRQWVETLSGAAGVEEHVRLGEWAVGPGKTVDIPPRLRGSWIESLKKNVAKRADDWFTANNVATPADLLVPSEARVDHSGVSSIKEIVEEQRLRSSVLRAVSVMTVEELAALPIPAGVLNRLLDRRT